MTLMLRTHRPGSLLLALAILAATPAASIGQDDGGVGMVRPEGDGERYWPRWRGPSGQGVVEETGFPDTWSDTSNVLWKTSVPGSGHSSPIVWNDRIFLTTSRNGGRRVSILSFRRSDGALLWETDAPEGRAEYVHGKNSPAAATATTDGERVYASFGSRGMLAVDFDGNIVWHRDLGRIDNYHGPAGSPLLYRDTVIIYQDQNGGAFVIALDTRTGETRWRTDRSASVGWGTPIAVTVGDHDELIVSSQRQVQSYDPVSGEELWSCGGNLFEVIPTPVVGHGLIFCASGRAGPTLAIRPGGRGDVSDTHVAWKTTRGSPFVPSPVVYGDYLYQLNDMSSIVTCLNAKTGETVWQERLGRPRREGISASPVVVDDKLFVTNDDGETFVLKTGPEFELLHINDIGARTLASPALVDGIWYIRTSQELFAIGN
ncbi:MAG: PQQ-binding-like beta-propeller repeat protein [Vicinamibacterales bacterium]|jgi:outer membrane protein assembly factor BamB|nr:PQQ-binding-like beta-propeller repeat protein [Vicinamibacterales bacterium]